MTYADLQVTRVVLGELAPFIDARAPRLLSTAQAQMSTLQQALLATREHGRWTSLSEASLSARQHVDGAIGALLETLSSVPDLPRGSPQSLSQTRDPPDHPSSQATQRQDRRSARAARR